jgi:hypothetical protein
MRLRLVVTTSVIINCTMEVIVPASGIYNYIARMVIKMVWRYFGFPIQAASSRVTTDSSEIYG